MKLDGKSTMISLGRYPDVSIAAARESRDTRKKQHHHGDKTFEEAANLWFSKKKYTSQKNADTEWGRIKNYLIPVLGKLKMSEIEPAHIIPVLKLIEKKGYLELARRVRSITSQVFRYGVANLMCSGDPADLLKGSTEMPVVKPMPAIVDEDGFSDLLKRIDSADCSGRYRTDRVSSYDKWPSKPIV